MPVPKEEVESALAATDAVLKPATTRQLAQALDKLVRVFIRSVPSTFANVERNGQVVEGTSGLYYDALDDMPTDLLDRAVIAVIRESKWFPTPAEIRSPVLIELRERQDARRRLQTALTFAMRGDKASA